MSKIVPFYHKKQFLGNRIILEVKIFKLIDSRYPDKVKYSLICIDIDTNKRVLMDNHSPKGHHYHIDESEYCYNFRSINSLLEDFDLLVNKHFREEI